MRPISVTQGAVGPSAWIPLDYLQRPFNVALLASLSEDASGVTYKVEYTPDNPQENRNNGCYVTRSGAVATVTVASPHGLSAGDSAILESTLVGWDGTYVVASAPTETTFTVAVANSGATIDQYVSRYVGMRVFPHDYMVALTAKADGNFAFPVMACRLNVSAIAAGYVQLTVIQGHARG